MSNEEFYTEAEKILDISFKQLRKAEKIENHLDEDEPLRKVLSYVASINAIRSIFDRAMWDMAEPKLRINKRFEVKFPIFYTEKRFNDWWNRVKDLYSNYDGLEDFLKMTQPYGVFPETNKQLENIQDHLESTSFLARFSFILSAFDNASKHRVLVKIDNSINSSRAELELVEGEIVKTVDEDQYSFFITDYNNSFKEFTIYSPWWPEATIKQAAQILLFLMKTKDFKEKSVKGGGVGFNMYLNK